MSNGSKKCSECGCVKPLERFHRHHRSADGHISRCKDCRGEWTIEKDRAAKRKWREEKPDALRASRRQYAERNRDKVKASKLRYVENNRDKVRATKRKWSERNVDREREKVQRRRARLRRASIFVITIRDLGRLAGMPCIACGDTANSVDHVLPLARGGCHGVGNLAPMCSACNSSKGAKTVTEWRKANNWLPLGSFPRRKDRADGAA